MREIKFRQYIWSDDSKKKLGVMISWEELLAEETENLALCFTTQFSNTSPLMQYTGLKDKNGVEIYEGDIFGGFWGDCYIGYCDECKSFQIIMRDFGCASCEGDVHWWEIVSDDAIEVIGNIYENPELLEEI